MKKHRDRSRCLDCLDMTAMTIKAWRIPRVARKRLPD